MNFNLNLGFWQNIFLILLTVLFVDFVNTNSVQSTYLQSVEHFADTEKDSVLRNINTLPGFEVQKVYEVPREHQGSWVALSVGPKGHLIASDQERKGMYRIKITGDINNPKARIEELIMPISGAQGLQWIDDYFYVNVNGRGLFRMKQDEEKDRFNILEYLGGPDGGGEHGNHALIKAHENSDLFMVNGNHTPPPVFTSSSIKNWKEDILLPRNWDSYGHARGLTAPGGYIARINSNATEWHMVSIGYRNTYDIALNQQGDLFAYDSDMEWDMGMPWYRPTRLIHAVSGSDYGWRSGSGKWKEYYEDSLPPVVNVGPGSPTGLLFGYGTRYPAKYQQALFGLDWTFGTMYAFHIKPDGASYTAEVEEFLSGSPLPLTDAVIRSDGYLYFVTGGRDKESALYRVIYKGNESTTETVRFEEDQETKKARRLRKRLEVFHGTHDPEAIRTAWPHLNSSDRFIRHAARVAIEWQPVDGWAEKAMNEVRPQARITALVALARAGSEEYRKGATESLIELNFNALTPMQKLGYLRAASLIFMRLGDPDDQQRSEITETLLEQLPHEDERVNTEAIRLLVYLEESRVIEKALVLLQENKEPPVPDWNASLISRSEEYGGTIMEMLNNPPPVHKLEYAFILRNLAHGWTIEQRREYFTFINEVSEQGMGGRSYSGFLERMRDEALRNASEEEIAAVSDLTGVSLNRTPDFEINPPAGPGREWTVEEAVKVLNEEQNKNDEEINSQLSFERGRSLFHTTTCASCHRLGGFGGNIGPDLSSVSNRFNREEILEEIIHPSRVISDQYSSYMVKTNDGESYTGQIVKRRDTVEIYTQHMDQPPTIIPRNQVTSIEKVDTSQMPPGLINTLNPDELKNLLAYLTSGGNPEADVYKKKDDKGSLENEEEVAQKSEISNQDHTYTNPLILQRADPWVYKHTDGYYYFTATVPEYDRLEIRRAKTIEGLKDADPKVIWRKHETGPMGSHIWAPELHHIDGKWYLYFAAGGAEDIWAIRMYVLENEADNPLEGKWIEKGQTKTKWETFSLDATTFEHRGTRYMVWAQHPPDMDGNTALFIAEMDTPWSIVQPQVELTRPEYDWEIQLFKVNEGAAVIKRNGKIFMTFSASGTDHNYAMGLLTADEDADLLDSDSWSKSVEPVFKTSEENGIYGPGHNSFTTTPDGSVDLIVYHARSYKEIEGDPLDDPNRHTRVQVLHWNDDGTPDFGIPLPDNAPTDPNKR